MAEEPSKKVRNERLGGALRANLQRRKAQARARKNAREEGQGAPKPDPGSPRDPEERA